MECVLGTRPGNHHNPGINVPESHASSEMHAMVDRRELRYVQTTNRF
jgi:hypothetical protein